MDTSHIPQLPTNLQALFQNRVTQGERKTICLYNWYGLYKDVRSLTLFHQISEMATRTHRVPDLPSPP